MILLLLIVIDNTLHFGYYIIEHFLYITTLRILISNPFYTFGPHHTYCFLDLCAKRILFSDGHCQRACCSPYCIQILIIAHFENLRCTRLCSKLFIINLCGKKNIIISILGMINLRHWEVKELSQGQVPYKWQG